MLENLSQALLANGAVVAPQPENDQLRLLARIKRAVRRKTSSGVQQLTVELQGEAVVLGGRCTSFYCKQIAQEAAMGFLRKGEDQLLNGIEVVLKPH